MLSIQLAQKNFWDASVEGYVFFLKENLEPTTALAPLSLVEKDFYPHLKDILKKHNFEGKKGQSFVLSTLRDKALVQFIFIGVGALTDDGATNTETLRRAMSTMVQTLKKLSIKTAVFALADEAPFALSQTELLKHIGIAALMTAYEFATFKTEKKKEIWECKLFVAPTQNLDKAPYQAAIATATIMGSAINHARLMADTPADIM